MNRELTSLLGSAIASGSAVCGERSRLVVELVDSRSKLVCSLFTEQCSEAGC